MINQDFKELQEAYEQLRIANEKLYTSMKAFQIAAEESGSLVFTYDADKQTIFVDERTAASFGVQPVQTGIPYDMVRMGIVSEDTTDTYIRAHEAIIRGEKESGGIIKLIQADGSSAVYDLKLRAILNEDGSASRTAVGVYRNITNRYIKDMEQERYQKAVLASNLYTFQYDVERDVFTVFAPSPKLKDTEVQYSFPHFMEKAEQGEVCPPEDLVILREFFKDGSVRPIQLRFHTITNSLRWYAISGSAVKEDGRAVSIFGSLSDITNVKDQETAFRKMQRALEGMKDEYIGIFELDLKADSFTVLSYDPSSSYPLPEQGRYSDFIQLAAKQLVAPEYLEDFLRFCNPENLLKKLKEERRVEFEFMTMSQAPNWQRSVFRGVDFDGDTPGKVLLYQSDIDSQKAERLAQQQALTEAYRYAEAANAAKTDFLSRMSHDIRTPMNAIIGMTAIASAHLDNPQRLKECLAKITTSSKHLLTLINEVLDMSKIESGAIELQEEEFNLADLIDNMVAMVLPQINERGHKLHVNIGNLIHEHVIGDSLRIQQAFVNLISNAVKYTPDGGNIHVSIKEKPVPGHSYGEYEFCFEDNGIGMTPEFQKVLFDPFTRAEDSRLSKVTGTGLGMAITKNLIRMMAGDIRVESELNKGSRFTVTIHLKLQNTTGEDLKQFQKLPVLVVDDDESVCESTGLILNSIGMDGEWCTTGEDAIRMVQNRQEQGEDYFAVILDWKMPGMDGVDTAREIRRIAGDEIPIIFLTAYDYTEIEEEARAAGVNKFLVKPLFKSRLLASFRELLDENGPDGDFSDRASTNDFLAANPLFPTKSHDFSRCRILLAEDNDLNAEIAMELLKMTGAHIDWARDGKEAASMVRQAPEGYYQLVLMDVQMPGMNGYQATEAIRNLPRFDVQSLPIIAMTANAFAEDISHAMSAGMNGHISKPVDFVQLGELLEKYLAE